MGGWEMKVKLQTPRTKNGEDGREDNESDLSFKSHLSWHVSGWRERVTHSNPLQYNRSTKDFVCLWFQRDLIWAIYNVAYSEKVTGLINHIKFFKSHLALGHCSFWAQFPTLGFFRRKCRVAGATHSQEQQKVWLYLPSFLYILMFKNRSIWKIVQINLYTSL